MTPKVFIVQPGVGVLAIKDMFTDNGWEVTDDFDEADLIQFTGGEDVSPILYQEEQHRETHANLTRDIREISYFFRALGLSKPMAGICRGGQFLNVCNGGKMNQHVEGHTTSHRLLFDKGWEVTEYVPTDYEVSSTHHQQMVPGFRGRVLYVADDFGVEIVYYNKTKCLCFQPHPEMYGYAGCTELYFKLIKGYLQEKTDGN